MSCQHSLGTEKDRQTSIICFARGPQNCTILKIVVPQIMVFFASREYLAQDDSGSHSGASAPVTLAQSHLSASTHPSQASRGWASKLKEALMTGEELPNFDFVGVSTPFRGQRSNMNQSILKPHEPVRQPQSQPSQVAATPRYREQLPAQGESEGNFDYGSVFDDLFG